jgi:probable HAF family extracellular repeat protein
MRLNLCALWLFCSGICCPTAHVRAAAFYPLGADRTAKAVTNDGIIVLTGDSIWTISGGHVAIIPDSDEVYARDISNSGIVAGLWCGPNTGSCYEAFRTPVGGPVQGLGAFDNSASDAFAITPDGAVVVGNASSPSGPQSFRWTNATGLFPLGHLQPGATSQDVAYDVSADGSVIVGQSGDGSSTEAFRWTQATGMVGLGDLAGGEFNSTASDISADGSVIVGTGHSALGTEAFRWTQATGMVGLSDLHAAPFHSETTAISADGNAVYGFSRPNLDAWVWTQSTGMQKVQDLLVNEHGLGAELAGWRISQIDDVSDNGLVLVGNGLNPAGRFEGFVVVIPEPSSTKLLLGMFVAILCPAWLIVRRK